MKKTILLLGILIGYQVSVNAQATIYDTTHAATNGAEITGTANGLGTSFGDAIQLAGTERLLNVISVNLFNLTDTSDFTLTMTLFSDCPTTTGAGACGSGIGTLIPFSESIVTVTAPPVTGQFVVEFDYNGLDITDYALDNTITVMLKASRNNVFWIINETPVIGSLPVGDTALSSLTRCGSIVANNGCGRAFTAPTINNVGMTITASPVLKTNEFSDSSFSVYPNPATNLVKISSKENVVVNAISITDINGRVVKNNKFENRANIEVNISDLTSGVYLIKITSNEGTETKKIIKN